MLSEESLVLGQSDTETIGLSKTSVTKKSKRGSKRTSSTKDTVPSGKGGRTHKERRLRRANSESASTLMEAKCSGSSADGDSIDTVASCLLSAFSDIQRSPGGTLDVCRTLSPGLDKLTEDSAERSVTIETWEESEGPQMKIIEEEEETEGQGREKAEAGSGDVIDLKKSFSPSQVKKISKKGGEGGVGESKSKPSLENTSRAALELNDVFCSAALASKRRKSIVVSILFSSLPFAIFFFLCYNMYPQKAAEVESMTSSSSPTMVEIIGSLERNLSQVASKIKEEDLLQIEANLTTSLMDNKTDPSQVEVKKAMRDYFLRQVKTPRQEGNPPPSLPLSLSLSPSLPTPLFLFFFFCFLFFFFD